MRHHFGDMLDRDGGYWTIVPNRERYAYRFGDVPAGSKEVTIVTIGKDDANWSRALTLPNLEELTLHEPTVEQLGAIGELHLLKRLRITHAPPAQRSSSSERCSGWKNWSWNTSQASMTCHRCSV